MIPLATILKAAQTWKYKGDTNDETAMRAFCADCVDKGAKLLIDGKHATRAAVLEVETPADVTADAPATFGDVTADATVRTAAASSNTATLEQEVSHLKATVRKLDARVAGGAPGAIVEKDPMHIEVRSVGEALWDINKTKGQNAFSDYKTAEAFRQALVFEFGSLFKTNPASPEVVRKAGEHLIKSGVATKDYVTSRNYSTTYQGAGGALTSQAFLPDMLKLVNNWGNARKLAKVVPMEQARVIRPRSTGDFAMEYLTELSATTAQRNTYSNIVLDAKTAIIGCTVSSQVLQDGNVGVAEDIAIDMARGVGRQEERNLFLGDATATYGYMTGFKLAFTNAGAGTITDAQGVIDGGTSAAAHTDAQLLNMLAELPDYAWPGAVWVCHPKNVSRIFHRLATTTPGGLTLENFDTLGLGRKMAYRGIPIMTSNAIESTDNGSAGQVDVYLGDFSMAAMIGDRMGLSIEVDNSVGFREYAVAIRGVVRHDIVVHDVGNATTAGPVVCLVQT